MANVTSPSTKVSVGNEAERETKIGEVRITFFGPRRFDIEVSGKVTNGAMQKCRRRLFKAISANLASTRRSNQKRKLLQEKEAATVIAEKEAEADAAKVEPTLEGGKAAEPNLLDQMTNGPASTENKGE